MAAAPYLTEIRMFAAEANPFGWVPCDGRLLPVKDHAAVFALIGTAFGGDGRTTFAVPDLRDRVPLGRSDDQPGGRPMGQTGGATEVTLSPQELPAHTHAVVGEDVSPAAGSGEQPGPERVICNSAPERLYGPAEHLEPMHENAIRPAGASQPHGNVQPYLTLAFFMAIEGLFPSLGEGGPE